MQPLIIIYGPTAVGKTECADFLAKQFPIEIINMDVGQLYVPLSIGTAKPDWKNSPIAHHLFDYLDKPVSWSVADYRTKALDIIKEIRARGNTPVLVGGSSFYLKSLLFPPAQPTSLKQSIPPLPENTDDAWRLLSHIDPERAKAIHQNDRYRIYRALELWYSTGTKPSHAKPTYNPPEPYLLIMLNRDRTDLYNRINKRTEQMVQAGLIDEVKPLLGTVWEPFLMEKKLIGYDDTITYLHSGDQTKEAYQQLIQTIAQKTRQYAKRQIIFWRMLENKLQHELKKGIQPEGKVVTLNLTLSSFDLYIKHLSLMIKN